MTNYINKGGRPPVANKCSHHVKASFNDLEWDELTRMMERANTTVKATFIKQLIFGKPFKVLTSDKSLAVYCAKLSEFFAQYHTIGVNYDLTVRTLRENFTEKKAMTALYKLEKLTIEMVGVMSEVVSLSEKIRAAMVAKISIGFLTDFRAVAWEYGNKSLTLPLNRSHKFNLIVDLVVSRREGYPPTFSNYYPTKSPLHIHLIH